VSEAPPPLPPFDAGANDVTTEPGIGISPEVIRLRRENRRLRSERDAARLQLAGLGSVPPEATRGQKTLQGLLTGTKYAALLSVAGFAARAIARKWPQYAEFVDAALQGLGL